MSSIECYSTCDASNFTAGKINLFFFAVGFVVVHQCNMYKKKKKILQRPRTSQNNLATVVSLWCYMLYLLCTLSRASVTWLETNSSITIFFFFSSSLTGADKPFVRLWANCSGQWGVEKRHSGHSGGKKETLSNEVALNLWFNLWENGFVLTAKFQHGDAILISRSGSPESPALRRVWAKDSTEMCRTAKNSLMQKVLLFVLLYLTKELSNGAEQAWCKTACLQID